MGRRGASDGAQGRRSRESCSAPPATQPRTRPPPREGRSEQRKVGLLRVKGALQRIRNRHIVKFACSTWASFVLHCGTTFTRLSPLNTILPVRVVETATQVQMRCRAPQTFVARARQSLVLALWELFIMPSIPFLT